MSPRPGLSAMLAPALAAGIACAAFRHHPSTPRVESVRPDSVAVPRGAVVELLVRGHGFEAGSPGHNTVRFGDVVVPDVPANGDGTEIRFVVPDVVPMRGDAAPMPLESGSYALSVQTPAGTSNAVVVRVYR